MRVNPNDKRERCPNDDTLMRKRKSDQVWVCACCGCEGTIQQLKEMRDNMPNATTGRHIDLMRL